MSAVTILLIKQPLARIVCGLLQPEKRVVSPSFFLGILCSKCNGGPSYSFDFAVAYDEVTIKLRRELC